MARHAPPGFPGALGSVDFSVWNVYYDSVADQHRNIGQYWVPEMRTKSVADDKLWVWNLKFGFLGALNDLNIFYCSQLFSEVRAGKCPMFKY